MPTDPARETVGCERCFHGGDGHAEGCGQCLQAACPCVKFVLPTPPAPSVRGAQVPEAAMDAAAAAFEDEYERQWVLAGDRWPHVEARRECIWAALAAAVPVLLSEQQQRIEALIEVAKSRRFPVHGGGVGAGFATEDELADLRAVLGSSEQGDKK